MVRPQFAGRRRGVGAGRSGRVHRRSAGFSLVEVLVAMVILAVGLLALQAMAMTAVRTGGQAERSSRAAAIAARYLEDGMLELRLGRIPAPVDCTLPGGEQVARVAGQTDDANLAFVQVQVTPEARGTAALLHTVRAYAYSADGFTAPAEAFTCP